MIRESGGDRSAVTGGTQVLSDWIRVRITAAPGSTFLDRMIKLVEGAERQKDAERDRAEYSAYWSDPDFRLRHRHHSELRRLRQRRDFSHHPCRLVRDADPDNNRRFAVSSIGIAPAWIGLSASMCWPCLVERSKPPAMSIRCCSTRPERSRLGNRQATEFKPLQGVTERDLADAGALLASLADETPEGRSIVVIGQGKIRHPWPRSGRHESATSSRSPRKAA